MREEAELRDNRKGVKRMENLHFTATSVSEKVFLMRKTKKKLANERREGETLGKCGRIVKRDFTTTTSFFDSIFSCFLSCVMEENIKERE